MKAFDMVPLELFFQILRKFGMPDHFVNLVIPLHTKCKIKLKVGDIDSELASDIGVRQDSCEGPVLFLFIIQAALEARAKAYVLHFGVRQDQRRRVPIREEDYHDLRSLGLALADDCGLLFETRA
jgi:hypothetical protein